METSHRRPNGRLAACNPCRARKVSCDHRQPVCTRCVKKDQGARCVYADTSARRSRESSSHFSEPVAHSVAQFELPPVGSPLPTARPARLGHTSVLEETQSTLMLLGGATTPDDDCGCTLPHQPTVPFQDLPYMIRETCLAVLRGLPGQKDEQMTYRDGSDPKGWTYIAVDRIIRTMRRMFAAVQHLGEEQALQAVAQKLCDNTSKPFKKDYPDCKAWLDSFCGSNVRWESIGLLWAHMERASDMFDALNESRLVRSKNNTSIEAARLNLEHCIKLSRHFNEASVFLFDLMRRAGTLTSLVDGELSLSSWETCAASIACMTFLNGHMEEQPKPYKPTFYSEHRRRMAVHVFTRDKLSVAFTGRPPLLSYRYFSTPMPLDISDEDLLDASSLERAAQALDSNGWNMAGKLCSNTSIRARFMIAMIRDELIEATLSKSGHVNIDYLLNLRNRQMALAEQFPAGLRYCASDLSSPDVPPNVAYMKTFTHLEHLQNLFFAERLLQRYNHIGNGELLIQSVTMVSLTLHFWMNQDRFSSPSMRRNFEWIVLSYGAPGAGILCQELLYPTFRGGHPLDPKVTRSSIIQQLSMLVGFCEWVRDEAPNATLCCNCSVIIQRVLDYTLNGGPDMDWGVFNQPDFSFELMDTFDWLRTDANITV